MKISEAILANESELLDFMTKEGTIKILKEKKIEKIIRPQGKNVLNFLTKKN